MTEIVAPNQAANGRRVDLVDRALADFRIRMLELEPAVTEAQKLEDALAALDSVPPAPGQQRARRAPARIARQPRRRPPARKKGAPRRGRPAVMLKAIREQPGQRIVDLGGLVGFDEGDARTVLEDLSRRGLLRFEDDRAYPA